MDDLITKTIKEIKEKEICPVARWKICLGNYLFWGLFALMILFGALSFALSVYLTAELDWPTMGFVSSGRLIIILKALPYFWLMMMFVFLVISLVNFRHTKKGYRYNSYKISGAVIAISIGFGSVIYITRAQEAVNESIAKHIPSYNYLIVTKERFWSQPENGLLGGMIIFVTDEGINLQDFQGHRWEIVPMPQMVVRPKVELQQEEIIKVIGQKKEDSIFEADEIRPWQGNGMKAQKGRKEIESDGNDYEEN